MRLGNVVDEKSSSGGEGQGDKPIGRSKSKRSSLDFKVSSYHSSGSAITTKPGKRKNRQQQQQQQFEEEQLKQQQQIRRPYLSRARGHSGPPPRKWELADLQNMNEEELLQALYADPQLAQEAARMAEKIAAEKGTSPSAVPSGNPTRRPTSTPGRGKRGSRAAGRNGPGEYPDHMRELMDGGFPFMQWMILLVLLGAAFYQLRKMLSLPDPHTKDLYRRRPRAKGEPKNGAKKTKASTEDLASLDKVALAIDADILSSENVKGKAANKKTTAAATTKKQKVKKEKGNAKNNNPATAATKTNQQKQEDTTDDNSVGSDDGDFPAPRAAVAVKAAPPVRVPATAPLPTLSASTANADDGNGWQTVSKTTRGAVEPTLEGGKSSGQNSEKPAASPLVESKENTPPTATTALNGKNDAAAAKTKKKQKKGKGKGLDNNISNAATNPSKDRLEDDAALAQELQREEDKMAQGKNNASDGDNTWEEVSTRKRKGAKPDAATN
jgi:hypothetical protein